MISSVPVLAPMQGLVATVLEAVVWELLVVEAVVWAMMQVVVSAVAVMWELVVVEAVLQAMVAEPKSDRSAPKKAQRTWRERQRRQPS
jgi:hypothetical protein